MSEITLQETTAGGYDVPDTYGSSYEPTTPNGSLTALGFGRTSGAKVTTQRTIISFDLEDGGLAAPVKVIDSKLSFYIYSYTASPGVNSYVYRIREGRYDWTEADATWNNYKSGTPWGTACCDSATTDMTTVNGQLFTSPTATSAWLDIEGSDLDAQVQYAANFNTSPNRTTHFLVRVAAQGQSEDDDTNFLARSSSYTTESQRPKLWVRYRRVMLLADAQKWLTWFKLAPAIAPMAFIGFIINRRMILERTSKKVLFHGTEKEWEKWRSSS